MIYYSIIIPHYNTWDLLEKLIDSIPISEEYEVIVVDDHSKRLDTPDFAARFERIQDKIKQRNGRFINSDRGQSAGACRNIGLKYATGKWLLFADADDYFLPSLEKVLEEHKNSEADIVYFAPTSEYLSTGEKAHRHEEFAGMIDRFIKSKKEKGRAFGNDGLHNLGGAELSLRFNWAAPFCKLVRRQMVSDNGILFSETIVSNDVMFSIKCGYFAKSIAADARQCYSIVRKSHSLTTNSDEERYKVRIDIFIEEYNFLKEHLAKRDFNELGYTGKVILGTALVNGYSARNIIGYYRKLKKNGVKMFAIRALPGDVKMLVVGVCRKIIENRKI